MRVAQKESSETASDGLKPAFWMTDYKQPKRCKKGSCAFQTVSKVSKNRSRRALFNNSVSKHTEDITVSFSLRNMIWRFRDCLGRWNSGI